MDLFLSTSWLVDFKWLYNFTQLSRIYNLLIYFLVSVILFTGLYTTLLSTEL